MPRQRKSQIQAAIREAAAAYAKAHKLRGGAAYHIAKVGRLPLSSVQGFLTKDNKHLATVEAIAEVLELRVIIASTVESRKPYR